jgi:thymidylate kinase
MKGTPGNRHALLISFSGIDGAGKSTQIANLQSFLAAAGLRVELVKFWDDVARLTSLRQSLSLSLFKGDPGVGTPETPVNRRDKNVQSPLLNTARCFLYLFDALALRFTSARTRSEHGDAMIFDRYIYDELANLPMENAVLRGLAKVILRLAPRPDIAFVLDAEPEQARARKPEYPLEFVSRNRANYIAIGDLAGIVVVPPGNKTEVADFVIREVARKLCIGAKPLFEPAKLAS